MRENAAWHLRRYRDRALPDWRVRQIFEREFNDLVTGYSALRSEMDELQRAVPNRLVSFETASDLALQWLGENRFDLALREIQQAGRELAELERCVAVAVDWRRMCSTLDGFEALLSPELGSQPTVQILWRLRDLARSFLDEGETRKASFVILLLAGQIVVLSARSRGELSLALGRMLNGLETQSTAASRIRELGRDGYHALAERLADDLETDLAVTGRARRAATAEGALGELESDLASIRQQAQAVQAALTQWLATNS